MDNITRFNTVEKGEPNWWWVWSDGKYLRTYEVVTLLNEYTLKINDLIKENQELKKENNILKKRVG